MKEIEIRKARSGDSGAIGRLYAELYRVHHLAEPGIFKHIPKDEASTDEVDTLKGNTENILVASIDSVVVGYLEYFEKKIEETELLNFRHMYCVSEVIVAPNFRNAKIGTKLLESLEEIAKKNSIDSIEVPVFSFNERAMGFYARNGYHEYVRRVRKEIKL